MDTLDLLKSLTKGVDNKVSQEKVEMTYEVNTSLKQRQKEKSLPTTMSHSWKPKIDRGGNPFKRGPRKKKIENEEEIVKNNEVLNSVEESVVEEEIVDDSFGEDVENKENNNEEAVGLTEDTEFVVEECEVNDSDNEEVLISEDSNEEAVGVEEEDFTPEDFEIGESDSEENLISVLIDKMNDNEVEKNSEIDDSLKVSEKDEIDNNKKDTEEKEEDINKDSVKEIKTEKLKIDENISNNDIEYNVDIVENGKNETSVENKNSADEDAPKDTENVNEIEDEKFKNCHYESGMSIEEFLRANKNYRDSIYVEHFYSKDYLDSLLKQGIILKKNDKYRF